MLVFVVFCKESRLWVGKNLIATKQFSIFFTISFVLEWHIVTPEATTQGVPSKCLSRTEYLVSEYSTFYRVKNSF